MKKIIKNLIAQVYYHTIKKYQNIVGNRIVLYHSIGSKLDHDTYGISISKERFTEHILYLKDKYEIIPINEHYQNNLDRDTISITFDDGYKDNLIALEICEEYKIPFTLYIATGFIGKNNYLTKEDIKIFSESTQCTLGTHSVTHPHLDTLSYDEQYKELEESKKVLEDIVGYKITHFSYPYGRYNKDTIKIIDKIGYNIISSSHIGLNDVKNLDFKRLKRIEIVANDDLKELDKKIHGYYDYLEYKVYV